MFEVGQKLKNERIKKDISVEEVSNRLKIRASQIINIEEGDLKEFDPFYLKYFVREYAKILDLDYKAVIAEYEVEMGVDKPNTIDNTNVDKYDSKRVKLPNRKVVGEKTLYSSNGNLRKYIVLIIILAVVLLSSFGIWTLYNNYKDSLTLEDNQSVIEPTVVETPTEEEVVEEEVVEEEVVQPLLVYVDSEFSEVVRYETFSYNLVNAEEIDLELKWFGQAYVSIIDGDEKLVNAVKDDGYSFSQVFSSDEIYINIGASQFVEVYVNGILLEYQPWEQNRYVAKISLNKEENE